MIRTRFSDIRKLGLGPCTFAKMSNLQFLWFKGEYDLDGIDYLPEGLQSMSSELRFFCWEHYPFKSLPNKFSMERLVMLDLSGSKMEKLWDGVQVKTYMSFC